MCHVTKTIPLVPLSPPTPETMLKHYNDLTYITEVINNIEWWGMGGGVAYFKLTIVKLFKISKDVADVLSGIVGTRRGKFKFKAPTVKIIIV